MQYYNIFAIILNASNLDTNYNYNYSTTKLMLHHKMHIKTVDETIVKTKKLKQDTKCCEVDNKGNGAVERKRIQLNLIQLKVIVI